MRPLRVADAVRDAAGRVDVHPPRAAAPRRSPCERRARQRTVGAGGLRVAHPGARPLPALVERSALLAQAVDRPAGGQRQRGKPLPAAAPAAQRRISRRAVHAHLRARLQYDGALVQQAQAQRRGRDLERAVAGRERPDSGRGLRDGARLGARLHDPVVGPGCGARLDAEDARTVAGGLEHVAGRRREGDPRCGRAEAALPVEREERGGIEWHRRRLRDRVYPAYAGSGSPGTATAIANRPPECGSRASSSSERNCRALVT